LAKPSRYYGVLDTTILMYGNVWGREIVLDATKRRLKTEVMELGEGL
jgi:hypothetical protein